LTIQTASPTGSYAKESHEKPGRSALLGVASALLLPFGSLLAFSRRRRFSLRMLGVAAVVVLSAGAIGGCSSYGMSGTAGTPAGASNVTISATAGGITQSAVVVLTVQ